MRSCWSVIRRINAAISLHEAIQTLAQLLDLHLTVCSS
jgi:hypothetical protein